mmetsp:Transcript_6923/g.9946  ORF Transcript_6923/g.9946 Transcript_6923/m.9946 type:complete len:524 (-) Transcript_6923:251-1822(-)|eukprot:CAMPEP_0184865508 /NCGR_PEP_ID=MMETSP0580-20130426/18347_1 /TAXON_ID=1118495 /ORGANISM="Dactyliosolen fragilissimus" /LENGTH=523 /DNA_ID=CAMNT_0027364743 /DNA_START=130 /DNA_END=1701 /DNA_ORIENTATION=+
MVLSFTSFMSQTIYACTLLFVLENASGYASFRPLGMSRSATRSRGVASRRIVKVAATRESSSVDNENLSLDDNDQKQWWQTIKLEGDSLAKETRPDFPILFTNCPSDDEKSSKPLIYLDSAATSQKPNFVTDAILNYYQTSNSNVHRGAHYLSREATAQYEKARDAIANLVNSHSRNEIVFTSGATEAINLVASTYGRANIQSGDEIIISELEHHSNIVPWQILAEEKGAILRFVPVDPTNGCLDMKAFQSLLNPNTKIVSLQHVSNVLGCINPIHDIVQLTRSSASKDCKILLDACQSVPHMKVNVQQLGVDFLAASGHKMCGPTGIGFLWGKEDILNSMPPYMGGGEMIDEVYTTHSTFAKAPARFEAGTPAIAQSVGLGAAIQYLNDIGGMERIEKYEHELADYLLRRMTEVEGIQVLGPPVGTPRGATVSFVCDKVHASDLGTFLDMEGVAIRAGHHCCQPLHRSLGYSHSARASLYFYNTKEEIDRFIEVLEDTIKFLGGIGTSDLDDDDEDDFVPFI